MSDDLEKRLRVLYPSHPIVMGAADELARLRAENEVDQIVRDECFKALGPSCHFWGDVPGHISELAGECERLRELMPTLNRLQSSATPMDNETMDAVIPPAVWREFVDALARAALKEGADK